MSLARGLIKTTGALVVAALVTSVQVSHAAAGTNRWTASGPEGGIVRVVAVDPNDPTHVLAGTQGAGIFRTTTGAASWARSSTGLHRDAMVSDIEFAPAAPDIVHAATEIGAYRSTDGGLTWTRIFNESTVDSVTTDPADANTVFVTTPLTAYRSTDAGQTWEQVQGPHGFFPVTTIVFAPSDPEVAYAANHAELFRSTDAGVTWTTRSVPHGHVNDLAVHPNDSDALVIGTASAGAFRSTDAGASWIPSSTGLPRLPGESSLYFSVLAVSFDPTNASRLHLAAERPGLIYRSTDGGATWSSRSIAAPYVPRAIAVSGARVYAGTTDGGALRSTDRGLTWTVSNDGLVASEVEDVLIIDARARTALAATGGQGVYRTTDAGASWLPSGLIGRRITSLSSSPLNPSLVYASGDDGLWRSRDAGRSWARVTSFSRRGIVAVAVAPTDPNRIYLVQFEYAWRSVDGGQTWSRMAHGGSFGSIAVHPRKANTVLIGGRDGVRRSSDGGVTWRLGTGLPYSNIFDLAIDPTRPMIVYAAIETDGVAKSRDGGATWRLRNTGLKSLWTHSVEVDPANPDRVYAGTLSVQVDTGGVYVSVNGAGSWAQMNRGLTTTWVQALAVSSSGARLYAGTTVSSLEGGGGAFTFVRQ